MRSMAQAFRFSQVAFTAVAFLVIFASERECFAQTRNRGRCALPSSTRISNDEVNNTVSCIENDLQSLRRDVRNDIVNLKEAINTLKHVVAYGEVSEDGSVHFVQSTPCEKLNLSFVSERPGLFRISFDHPLKTKPIIGITLIENGVNSSENSKVGWIAEVSESGFLVKTSLDGKTLGNVAFNVLILAGDLSGDQCSVN